MIQNIRIAFIKQQKLQITHMKLSILLKTIIIFSRANYTVSNKMVPFVPVKNNEFEQRM